MSIYFDASVLVSLFVRDALTSKATKKAETVVGAPIISNFAAAEFASALGKRIRMRNLTATEARKALATFDAWSTGFAVRVEAVSADVAVCEAFLRRLDLPLRTPDALNIAIARRLGAALLTFDATMAACARRLGVETA